MADNRQFGSPKVLQFGDKSAASQAGDAADCGQCEAMLADAVDGTLSAAEQAVFDLHVARCGPCGQLLADARRGAAWLEMLRDPRPEAPAELLELILAQTSGARGVESAIQPVELPGAAFAPAAVAAFGGAAAVGLGYAVSGAGSAGGAGLGKVLPFRTRIAAAVRASSFGQIMLQPRLAMTAAMAFLSVALTLDLTGVRLQDLRASNLRPASLERDFYSADARVVQYYEGLRVVYELESRVHDLQSASDNDAAAGSPSVPQAAPNQDEPGSLAPAAQPGPANQKAAPQPDRRKPAPNPGTSRREELERGRRLVASGRDERGLGNTIHARVDTIHVRVERALV